MSSLPLTSCIEPLRRATPADSPMPGIAARVGSRRVLLVDDETTRGWAGWRFCGVQHILAPVDVLRLPRRQVAMLPLCAMPLSRYLSGERAVSGGAAVTLAVSLLRGVRESGASSAGAGGEDPRGDGAVVGDEDEDLDPRASVRARRGAERAAPGGSGICGEWWLSELGRPLFCIGRGAPIAEAASALTRELAVRCSDRVVRGLLVQLADALGDPPVAEAAPVLARVEQGLFDACAPQPLELGEEPPGEQRPAPARSRRAVRRPRDARASRRTIFLAVATVLALLVLGALWIADGGDGPASVADAAVPTPGEDAPSPSPGPSPIQSPTTESQDLASIGRELLARAAVCRARGDPCTGVLLTPGLRDRLPEDGLVELVDDLGGVAILRVRDPGGRGDPAGRGGSARNGGGEQGGDLSRESEAWYLTIARADAAQGHSPGQAQKWLIRDVQHVADQPEGGSQIPRSPSKDASSRRSLTAPRKRAASAPSTMRWS